MLVSIKSLFRELKLGQNSTVEATKNHWENFQVEIESLLSEVEDTDIAKAITELTTRESVYEASLATAATIIQPTLVNFLK